VGRLIATSALVAALVYSGCASAPRHDPFKERMLCILPETIKDELTWRWPAVSPDGKHYAWVAKQADGRWIAMVDGRPRFTPHPDI
jgi:hypothetical protein